MAAGLGRLLSGSTSSAIATAPKTTPVTRSAASLSAPMTMAIP